MAVTIDQDACISCGACADSCPVEIIDASDKATLTAEDECLECGACRLLCDETVMEKWEYPRGSYGIEHRFG